MENGKWKMANGQTAVARLLTFAIFLLPFSIAFLVGCQPKPDRASTAYFGPTESMDDVVAAVNENNARLPTLWASIRDVRVIFTDDNGKPQDEKLDGGVLLYRQQPRSVRLNGDKLVLGNVMQLGSNENVYWLAIKEGPDTAWWGRHEHVGRECSQPIPIHPALLTEVLGVTM